MENNMDLFKYQDKKYKEFNDKIINQNKYPTIGIRIPTLRLLAREEAKNDYLSYINSKHTYYEEYMIMGLIIGYIKVDFKTRLELLDKYVPYIEDWALSDIVASNLKCFKNNLEDGYLYINKLLKGSSFSIRFGLVLLLDYYINDEYIDKVYDIILNIDDNNYYVEMALAWLISVIYIKYKDTAIKLIKSDKLSKNVINKAISKICDSYRVDNIDKIDIKKYRR